MELAAECPICMENYTPDRPPSTLVCGHTLCITCIHSLTDKAKKITCPIDKQTFIVPDIKPNYEMLHIIEACKSKYESYHKIREQLESSLQQLQSEIQDSKQEQNRIKDSLKEQHLEHLKKEVTSAVIITEEKAKKNLNKKLKEQEQKLTAKLLKEAQLIKEIEEKKREESLKAILKQKEEEMNRQKKVNEDLQNKFSKEKEKHTEEMKKKEKSMQKEMERKIKTEREEQERQMQLKLQQTLLEEKQKLEREARDRQEAMMLKFHEEQLALTRQQQAIELKRQQMEAELQSKIQQIEKENKEKQDQENLKRMADEQMAKAQQKVNEKFRKGKLGGNPSERPQRENMQRDNNRIYWAFRTPKGNYLEYYDNISGYIEKAFVQDKTFVYLKNRGSIDFMKWREVKETGEELMIKRVNSFCGNAKWRYRDEGEWVEFSPQDNFEIEKAWLTKRDNCMVLVGKHLDFNSLSVLIQGRHMPVLRDIVREEF